MRPGGQGGIPDSTAGNSKCRGCEEGRSLCVLEQLGRTEAGGGGGGGGDALEAAGAFSRVAGLLFAFRSFPWCLSTDD